MTHGAAPTSGASGLGAFACTARPGHLRLSRLVLSFLRGLGARREFSLMCFRIPHPTGDTHAGSGARTRGEAGPRVPPDSTQEARWDRLQTPSVVTPGVRPPPQPRSRRGKLAVRIADGCLASRLGGARVRPSRPRLCPGGRARLSHPRPPPGADCDGGGRFVEEAAGRRRTQGRDESRRGREAPGRPRARRLWASGCRRNGRNLGAPSLRGCRWPCSASCFPGVCLGRLSPVGQGPLGTSPTLNQLSALDGPPGPWLRPDQLGQPGAGLAAPASQSKAGLLLLYRSRRPWRRGRPAGPGTEAGGRGPGHPAAAFTRVRQLVENAGVQLA